MSFQQTYSQSFVILLSSLLFVGCLKKQNLDDPQVGPAIPQAEMFRLLSEDVGQFGFDQIRKKEVNVLVMSQRIEETTVRKLYQQSLYVKDLVTKPDGTPEYNFIQNLYYLPDQSQNKGFDFVTTSLTDLVSRNPILIPPIYWYTVMAMEFCSFTDVSCHNVVVSNESIVLDPDFADPSICADSNFCELKTKTVTFDTLEMEDGVRKKINYKFIVAPQLPFLSRVLKFCRRYTVKSPPRDYLEEICYDTAGFEIGEK